MRRLLALFLFGLACSPQAEFDQLELVVGGGVAWSGPNFYVTLTSEGALQIRRTGLPIIPPDKLTESVKSYRLDPSDAAAILRLAAKAEDFDESCDTVVDGTSARLLLTSPDSRVERICRNTAEWPTGEHTQQFLDQLNAHLPREEAIH